MQAGSGEHLGDLHLAQRWAKRLKSDDDVADEVRELVDGLPGLHQRRRTVLVDALHPGGNRIGLDE
jgi:hypothetical protein